MSKKESNPESFERLPIVGPYRDRALREFSSDQIYDFPEFIDQIRGRLDKGRGAYGEKSFTRSVNDLLGEIEEELLDVCGWSFVLWSRLKRLKEAIKEKESQLEL